MNSKISFGLLFILSLFILISCKKNLKDIITENKQATITIYTYDEYGAPSGSGSGFFINENGVGITNYHVLEGSTKAVIKTSDSIEYEIDQIIASDEKWDIAQFTIKNDKKKKFTYLKFANKPIEQGDKIYNISAPLGLEQTVSEGIVSSLREDSHGKIIQITAPISPGSSGSAILNDKGEVIAVATFCKQGGQNLNFGVSINKNSLSTLSKNDFTKKHPNFNIKENFIILNIPEERDGDLTLHALEFKKDATIAYFSYTNLNMLTENLCIWAELNKKDEGFLIKNRDTGDNYYIVSSTIGENKEKGTDIALATNHKFKVFFPPIKDTLQHIDITYGTTSRGWQFYNLDLNYYRNRISYETQKYIKEYAYSKMQQGNLMDAVAIFNSILEEDSEDIQALNVMGIISYVLDNNMDAQYYFTRAIETHPNNTTAYLNRSYLYKSRKEYTKAIDDITKAINIDPEQPDNYVHRGLIYNEMNEFNNAIKDYSKALESEDFKEDALLYFYRALCYAQTNKIEKAKQDIQSAYNYTTDTELETSLQEFWEMLHE